MVAEKTGLAEASSGALCDLFRDSIFVTCCQMCCVLEASELQLCCPEV